MPRPFKGQVIEYRGVLSIRLTLGKGNRPSFPLPPGTKHDGAERRRALLADIATRLRAAGRLEEAPRLLEMAAARTGRALEAVLAAVEAICLGQTLKKIDPGITFQQFAEDWTSGKLHERYPDHVKAKRTAGDDASRLKLHVYPRVGGTRLVDFELRHAQLVMAELPSTLAANTRRTIAQLMNRLLAMAVFPAGIIERNPLPPGFVPKPGKQKAMTYLYPDEDAALMKCKEVELVYRLIYGVLAREGLRTSELLGLTWRDLDLVRGTIALDKNKTDDPRPWVLDASVVVALRIWREQFRRDAADTALVFSDAEGVAIPHHPLARLLRAHLKKAGVKRPQLFAHNAHRQQMRAHDLRGTFVTLALALGKTETWVADRTSHKSSTMINRYRRAARQAAELNLGWLHQLHQAIPEIAEHHEQRARQRQPRRTPRRRRSPTRRPSGRR